MREHDIRPKRVAPSGRTRGSWRLPREWLAVAVEAARAGGDLLSRSQGRAVRRTMRRDVKIAADARLDRFLTRFLSQRTGLPVLSEESGETSGAVTDRGYRWIVDPLDGSLNHSRGLPLTAISIALWARDKPVIGVVHDPSRGETFSGLVRVGAWLGRRRIATSRIRRASEGVLCTGFPAAADFSSTAVGSFVRHVQRFHKVRLLGSAALSLAYVASGRVDAYHERDIKLWDVAAGVALVTAAGGEVTITPGRHALTREVVATNGRLKLTRSR